MEKKYFYLLVALGLLLILFGIDFHHSIKSVETVKPNVIIKLSFVGDLMCHSPQFSSARITTGSFDFKHVFQEIKNFLETSDATFGNLETVIAGSENKFTGYPAFNTPEEYLEALNYSGFDVLFTSNNHSFDRGKKGVFSTLSKIKEYGMIPVGTYFSKNDSDSSRILEIKGIKIGLLAYSYGLNTGLLNNKEDFLINIIDTNSIRSDIEKLNNNKPDLILIYYHFGEEYSRKPSSYQKQIVEKTFNYGADIIIGSHPHTIQPIELYTKQNGKLKKGLVAYSLGNFLSNQTWRYSDAGVILNMDITKSFIKDSLWISNINIIPTLVIKINSGHGSIFKILPSDSSLLKSFPKLLVKEQLPKIIQAYDDTHQMFKTNNMNN